MNTLFLPTNIDETQIHYGLEGLKYIIQIYMKD